MSIIILKQTTIMLMLILVGVMCRFTKIISDQTNKDLSKFVLQVVNPVMIFMSYQTEYKPELVKNLIICFALSLGTFGVMIILAGLIIRDKEGRDTAVERFSSIYSNCGFMGIPLVNAMYGLEGVFYLTAFITVFNLIVWTHGVILISGEKDFKKVLKVFCSPTIIAIILGIITFFLEIRLPEIPTKALEFISGMNTPMAMVVAGVTMASTNIPELLKKISVYKVCAIKLIIIPVVVALIIAFLPVDIKLKYIVIVAASAPPATTCTLFCLRYGKNSLYASEIFSAGTILSVITLPIITKLTEFLTKN